MSEARQPSVPVEPRRASASGAPVVEKDVARPANAPRPKPSRRSVDPADVVDWQSSSHALLTGLEVKDYSSRITTEVFDRLFKD